MLGELKGERNESEAVLRSYFVTRGKAGSRTKLACIQEGESEEIGLEGGIQRRKMDQVLDAQPCPSPQSSDCSATGAKRFLAQKLTGNNI